MKTKLIHLIAAVMIGIVHAAAQNPEMSQLMKRAASGDYDARMRMAVASMTGDGTDKNEEQGFYWLQKAAEKADPEAWYHLGECYLWERGVSRDIQKGLEYISRSAEAGFAPAQTCLGLMYFYGCAYEYVSEQMKYRPYDIPDMLKGELIRDGYYSIRYDDNEQIIPIPADRPLGIEWLTKAANRQDNSALYELAVIYWDGEEGVEPNEQQAYRQLRIAAENGMGIAARLTADFYREGLDGMTEPDTGLAFEWYRKAAECGDVSSMCWVAEYYSGKVESPVEPDAGKMIEWYRKAAEYPYPDIDGYDLWAQRQLGYIYRDGLHVQPDMAEAAKWLRMAAERGDAEAQYALADLYDDPKYGIKDSGKAIFWYKKSADKGHTAAMVNLSLKYLNGAGVAKNEQAALEYMSRAADAGSAMAVTNMGVFYWNGYGCTADRQKAIELCIKAGDMGYAAGYLKAGLFYDLLAQSEQNRKAKRELEQYAFAYTEKAAQMGDADAQFYLSTKYSLGQGCKENKDMQFYWLKKAMAQGHQGATELYNKLREIARQYNQPWRW